MTQFFETRMGQTFYDGTMRKLATAADRIATQLEQRATDSTALDRMAALLDGQSWTVADLDTIAQLLRATGRRVQPPSEG